MLANQLTGGNANDQLAGLNSLWGLNGLGLGNNLNALGSLGLLNSNSLGSLGANSQLNQMQQLLAQN